MIYQHPLAYLLGLQGAALIRAFAGGYDRDYTLARLAEVRALLAAADELGEGASAEPITTVDGYDSWAPFYDNPGNAMVEREQPIVQAILARLTAGRTRVVLDAACGTGRHTAFLASLGHTVIGVDSSPGMLDLARVRLPGVEFHEAGLHSLPLPDDHVDLVVCALALTHVPDLRPVLAEFARVLRPGGHVVISDSRGYVLGGTRFPMVIERPDGTFGYMPCWIHSATDYLKAALPLGFVVRQVEEPPSPAPLVDHTGTPPGDPEPIERYTANGKPPGIWELHPWAPEATNAMYRDKPHFIVWHFEYLPDGVQ